MMERQETLGRLEAAKRKGNYLRRVFAAYLFARNSQLTFWHESPSVNDMAVFDRIGQYYMPFEHKARYPGPFDDDGIPLLDYHGQVGRQYYSVAIAQYALASYNLFKRTRDALCFKRFIKNAEWLSENLMLTPSGTYLWANQFDFEYFQTLKAPWLSGLGQGQGLSVLIRAYSETGEPVFLEQAERVFQSLCLTIEEGGVLFCDSNGDYWIEEYIISTPTHILNGFIWALWGVYDYFLLTKESKAIGLFNSCCATILKHLSDYDAGFWSYYELTPQRVKSIASPFYHRLHVVQLNVMHKMTGDAQFYEYAKRWLSYLNNPVYRNLALMYKIGFKLVYY